MFITVLGADMHTGAVAKNWDYLQARLCGRAEEQTLWHWPLEGCCSRCTAYLDQEISDTHYTY